MQEHHVRHQANRTVNLLLGLAAARRGRLPANEYSAFIPGLRCGGSFPTTRLAIRPEEAIIAAEDIFVNAESVPRWCQAALVFLSVGTTEGLIR